MMRGAIHSPERVAAMAVLKRLERFGPDGHNCFPRGITFSDIDGVVELNGKVLFLEVKRTGQKVSMGQYLLLQVLAQHHTVLVMWIDAKGEVTNATQVLVGEQVLPEASSETELAEFFKEWAHT